MKSRRIGVLWVLAVLAACRTGGTGIPEAEPKAAPETMAAAEAGPEVKAAEGPGPASLPAESAVPEEVPRAASLSDAIRRACGELAGEIPASLSVAVIGVAAEDPAEGEFAAEELIFFLVNLKKYSVVERRRLDLIREEQQFQLSGEVDDATAVSIGRLSGAAIVITGSVSPYGAEKYLRLRVLDVETGQIRAASSWRFDL
jgi:curli biogenesis system outer membrane secretion channel CsgG